jgi:hypothetical protein
VSLVCTVFGTMMAPSTLSTIALLASLYIAYRITNNFLARRRLREFAKQHGCKEPLDTSGSWPYGWSTLWRLTCVMINIFKILSLVIAHHVQAHEDDGRRRAGRHPAGAPDG